MSLEHALTDAVGSTHVLTDRDLRAPYETDWTRRFTGPARAVVRPADTDQVAAVVRACAQHGVAIVTQGGNTGLAGLASPLPREWPVYLLLETDEPPELPDDVDAAFDPRLWVYRERHTEAISTLGVPHKLDVCLPLNRLADFLAGLPGAVAPYDAYVFGHLAMGNLHVNVVGPAPDDEAVDEAVLRLAASHGGSIAAEHGIGVAKVRWLELTRTQAEIDVNDPDQAGTRPGWAVQPGRAAAVSGRD